VLNPNPDKLEITNYLSALPALRDVVSTRRSPVGLTGRLPARRAYSSERGVRTRTGRKSKKAGIGWKQKKEAHICPIERDLNGG